MSKKYLLDNGVTLSVTHILDDNMDSYQVFLYKTTGDILEDNVVRFWGVPVGSSSFENVSGGTTNVQNFFGSHIEKINWKLANSFSLFEKEYFTERNAGTVLMFQKTIKTDFFGDYIIIRDLIFKQQKS